jgi:hypothetical protein
MFFPPIKKVETSFSNLIPTRRAAAEKLLMWEKQARERMMNHYEMSE